jgi:hypothetical protein
MSENFSAFGVVNPNEIKRSKVTAADIDSGMEMVIQPFIQDGRTEEYGAIIILSIPACRYVFLLRAL